MNILTVIGARPQFIKAASVSRVLRQYHREILVHTGQHYDKNMSDIFFEELNIPKPDYNLEVGSGSHGKQTGEMLYKIEELILREKPDMVLVYGDTNSTLAGALASSKLHIPVVHVEAGLRSYNKMMPEEQNRVLTDHISDLLLCPTETGVENLKREGITKGVYNIGDVMYDSVVYNISLAKNKKTFAEYVTSLVQCSEIEAKFNFTMDSLVPDGYLLTTIHRAENTEGSGKLETIINSLNECGYPVIFPVHPRIRKNINNILKSAGINETNILFVDPVGYLEMLILTQNAKKVVTDSGGLQKEAFFLKTPCITLRDETEWVETLNYGWNRLCKIDKMALLENISLAFDAQNVKQGNYFGNGDASVKAVEIISNL